MRALLTGATGFLGRQLLARLERPVVIVTRDAVAARQRLGALAEGVEIVGWDPLASALPAAALRDVDSVFHLAGDPVAEGRWTNDKKRRIRDSRVLGTRHLAQGIATAAARPRVLVSASAVGFYGSRGDAVLDESATPGDGFLADVCRGWETEAAAARALGVRVVTPRIGVVLGRGGGALAEMMPLFRRGLGGRLGDGAQWMPWIHVDDCVGLFLHAARRDDLDGPMNTCAPTPVTNREFTARLAEAVGMPARLAVPRLALRLALGEKASIVLGSQRAVPRVAERTGYTFAHPDLGEALRGLVARD